MSRDFVQVTEQVYNGYSSFGAGVYSGGWDVRFQRPSGEGEIVYQNGERYSGCWKDGKWHGKGELVVDGSTRYEGEFDKGDLHGEGIWKTLNFNCWGNWEKHMIREGQFSHKDRGHFEFMFRDQGIRALHLVDMFSDELLPRYEYLRRVLFPIGRLAMVRLFVDAMGEDAAKAVVEKLRTGQWGVTCQEELATRVSPEMLVEMGLAPAEVTIVGDVIARLQGPQ